MLTIFLSLTELFRKVVENELDFDDDPNYLYFFSNTTKDGIQSIIDLNKIPDFIASDILSEIEKAERFGRVFWGNDSQEMKNFFNKIQEMGVTNIPNLDSFNTDIYYNGNLIEKLLSSLSNQILISKYSSS